MPEEKESLHQFVARRADDIERAYRFVGQVQAKEQETQKTYYDRDAKEVTFSEDNEVMAMDVQQREASPALVQDSEGAFRSHLPRARLQDEEEAMKTRHCGLDEPWEWAKRGNRGTLLETYGSQLIELK
ncbi:hypothetical protein O3M35_002886 [Rhynocoris fuscipes]|uniref:Uncharacterized protein n=1 Tax=Rhynocoris fuscipes TaxID=488301 RepID=A0AAW1CT19_9HEMI